MSFDIKFTRQGFENACWHREACRAIQHAFSKPSLVNLISKDANLVFYLSVYPLLNTLQTSDYDVIFDFCVDSASLATSFKSATSSWPDKGNMPWDRKRLLGYVETIRLIWAVTDKNVYLTLNASIATNAVCFSRLLKCLRSLYGKQWGPRSDCSNRSSLFWVHAVCFYT